jgi:tetrahydromethanopterin S-methyltransferase subunit D
MAIIANDTQFIGIAPSIDLTGKKSAILNEQTEPVTMADIIETVGGGSSYLVYTALLTQSGTSAPVATVLENTLGGNVVWSYSSVGSYQATLTGSFTSKTFFYISSEASYNNGPQIYGQKIRNLTRLSNDIVSLNQTGLNFIAGVYSSAGGADNFTNVPIEIRVYP